MKLSHLLSQGNEKHEVRGVFEKGVLSTGKAVLLFVDLETGNNEKYVVIASLKNWPRFELWVGKRTKADIKKTAKTFEMMHGEEYQGVLINAKVVITIK